MYVCFYIFSPEGYLYDKEAILEYYIHQKNDYKRKLKEFEKQKKKLQVRIVVCTCTRISKLHGMLELWNKYRTVVSSFSIRV